MIRSSYLLCLLTLGHVCAGSASADIIEVGDDAVLAEPPANIAVDQWESNTDIRGFFERQTVLLSDLALDHVNTGLVDHKSLLVPGLVSAGTAVQSYLFHADSEDGFQAFLSGYVVFDAPIIGVLIKTASMNGTDDLLGRPGVTYGHTAGRRLELPPDSLDTFEISGDRMRLDFTLKFDAAYDEIRIVTGVPDGKGRCSGNEVLNASCKLKNGKFIVKGKLKNSAPGLEVTFRLDDDANTDVTKTVKDSGKATGKFKNATEGEHHVTVLPCDIEAHTNCMP